MSQNKDDRVLTAAEAKEFLDYCNAEKVDELTDFLEQAVRQVVLQQLQIEGLQQEREWLYSELEALTKELDEYRRLRQKGQGKKKGASPKKPTS